VLGTTLGLASAFFGGRFDSVSMRLIDVLIAFPTLVFAMFVIGVLGSGVVNGIIVIGLMFTPSIARVVRSAALGIVVRVPRIKRLRTSRPYRSVPNRKSVDGISLRCSKCMVSTS
jgi:hypothetical protein